ncbi:transposase [Streptomyces sp. MN13]
MVGIVERLVPDGLWELFQRLVPEAPTRPQGGGRRRHGDREVLAAIVFVATSGCTWQQLPAASFGPSAFGDPTGQPAPLLSGLDPLCLVAH